MTNLITLMETLVKKDGYLFASQWPAVLPVVVPGSFHLLAATIAPLVKLDESAF
jgi:hypothetical protein